MSESSAEDLKTDVATAESTPAPEDPGQKTLAEFLDDVASKYEDAPAEPAEDGESPAPIETDEPKAETDATKAPAAGEAEKTEEEPEPPFHKHPRWQELKGERDTLRGRVQELESQYTERKQDLESYDRLTGFCREHSLENNDLELLFQAGAAIKSGDAEQVLEILRPYYEQALEETGAKLPPALAARVETGDLDEETAVELSKLRAKHAAKSAPAKPGAQAAPVPDQSIITAVEAAKSAVNAVEAAFLQRDPDYRALRGEVATFFEAWTAKQRKIPTPAETVEAFNRIVEERRAAVKKLAGRSRTEVKARPTAAEAPATKQAQTRGDDLLSHLLLKIDEAPA